jgi:hypothetical protein
VTILGKYSRANSITYWFQNKRQALKKSHTSMTGASGSNIGTSTSFSSTTTILSTSLPTKVQEKLGVENSLLDEETISLSSPLKVINLSKPPVQSKRNPTSRVPFIPIPNAKDNRSAINPSTRRSHNSPFDFSRDTTTGKGDFALQAQYRELYKRLSSSPPTMSPNTSPNLEQIAFVGMKNQPGSGSGIENGNGRGNGHGKKRMLEWACEQQTNRRRVDTGMSEGDEIFFKLEDKYSHQNVTENSQEQEPKVHDQDNTTYSGQHLHLPNTNNFYSFTLINNHAGHPAESALSLLSLATSGEVSSSYNTPRHKPSQDVIFGASLLLGFKHSK